MLSTITIDKQDAVDIIYVLPLIKLLVLTSLVLEYSSTICTVVKPLCMLSNRSLTGNTFPVGKIAHVINRWYLTTNLCLL